MAEALSPSVGAEKDDELPNDDAFESQTRSIFKSFMFERLESQIEKEACEHFYACEGQKCIGGISRTVLEQFFKEEWPKEVRELGKALAETADGLDKKYHNVFARMVNNLGITPDTAYDTFAKVARKLFQDGINWGRIVALLLFGYEIAVSVMKQEDTDIKLFLEKIVSFVVTFFREEDTAAWIKHEGGWVAILDELKKNSNVWLERLIVVGGTIIVCYFLFVLKIKPK